MLLSSAFACQFASECRDHRSVNGISIRFCSVLMLSNFIDIILNRQGSVRWLSSVVVHRGSSLRMNDPRVSSLSQAPSEVGLRWREPGAEMRRAMVSGIVTGDAPVSSKNPRSLCES